MRWTTLLFLLLTGKIISAQPDYWAYQTYFSGCPINHIPKGISIPDKDNLSKKIMNAIINGSTYDQLLEEFPDSLDGRLENLISGKIIEKNGNGFSILFPVIVNDRRTELAGIIHESIMAKGLTIDTIIGILKQRFDKDPRMIFHFLWSRIIDDCWWDLYNETFKTKKGPPSIAFIVYPPHSFQCGTNSDYSESNDMFALSWSYNIFDESFRIPSAKSFFQLSRDTVISITDKEFFEKHGLLDPNHRSVLFTYHQNDPTDQMCDRLKELYINKVKGLLDYNELGKKFQIPPDELFIVCSHEIAYEIISETYRKRQIFVPILKEENPNVNFQYLVSIRNQK
jgi:hypothetical protein